MSQQICVFGEVLFDVFPDGHQVLGGAPFNVAWHLQAFGQHPSFISSVGNDAQGDLIRQAMIDWGMDDRALETEPSLATGKVMIELQDGEPSYDIVSPCAYDAIHLATAAPSNCQLLYHGSLAVRHDQSAAALDRLIASGPESIFVDVNLRSPWWEKPSVLTMIQQADWVKLNIDELDLLDPGDQSIAERLAHLIEAYRLQGVILTHGEAGAEVMTVTGEHARVKPDRNTVVVDTVGAGDAFASVVIMGLVNAWPMQITLDRAQAFASRIVGQRGATVSNPGFYQQVMQSWTE